MDAWCAWLAKQQETYQDISRLGADLIRGTRPERSWAARRGAFSVALIHPSPVALHYASLSSKIAALVPAVVYEQQHIHTTLVGMLFEEPFLYDSSNLQHQDTIERLTRAATTAAEQFRGSVEIGYTRPVLYTPEAVLAPGLPCAAFGELQSMLRDAAEKERVQVAPSWGSHVTLSRFTEATSTGLEDLLELLDSSSGPATSLPTKIAVGYSLWGPSPESPQAGQERVDGHFTIYRAFNLQQ